MHIKVTVKNVYGQRLAYPANSDATLVAGFAGTVSVTLSALKAVTRNGGTVEVDGSMDDREWLEEKLGVKVL